MADPTLVEVTIRLSPEQLEACSIMLAAEVEAVDDLIADSLAEGASDRFLAEMTLARDSWRALLLPLVEAGKRMGGRDRFAASGTIDTKPCPAKHEHNGLQRRCDEDGFPRVCEGCQRRFERVDF